MNETFVTVVGNVVADPVPRPTTSGRPLASLRVASTTRRWEAATRTFVDGTTNYVNVSAFNALAANVLASVRRGHPVVVHGRLRVNQWQTDTGENRSSVEVDAYTIGHDLSRGQTCFTKPERGQPDHARPDGSGAWAGPAEASPSAVDGVAAPVEASAQRATFDRSDEDADTDAYVVVGVG